MVSVMGPVSQSPSRVGTKNRDIVTRFFVPTHDGDHDTGPVTCVIQCHVTMTMAQVHDEDCEYAFIVRKKSWGSNLITCG